MTHVVSQEQRERLIFQVAQWLNFSSDEWLAEVPSGSSVDYAKGYLDAFLANAKDEDILFFYQFVRTVNMA
ncbi:MAG: hypothetical protein HDQ44_04890 [Desulfovibrio sp.]|nr:hypothetical protein [Desulfovibrio sp.]